MRRGEQQLLRKCAFEHRSWNARMALRVARQSDLAQSAAGQQVLAQDGRAVGVGSDGFGFVAAQDQRLANARFAHRAGQESLQLGAILDAPGGDVRYRFQARFAYRDERRQSVEQLVARKWLT